MSKLLLSLILIVGVLGLALLKLRGSPFKTSSSLPLGSPKNSVSVGVGNLQQDPKDPLVTVITLTQDPNITMLREARSSMLAQTFTRWTWVIVDDSSSVPVEGSGRNFTTLIEADSRMQVVHLTRASVCDTRKAAVNLVDTEYFLFLDNGDLLKPSALEQAVWFLSTNPGLAAAGFYSMVHGDRQYRYAHGFIDSSENLIVDTQETLAMVRTSAMRNGATAAPCLAKGEDWHMVIELAAQGFWGYSIPEFLHVRKNNTHGHNYTRFSAMHKATLEMHNPDLYWKGVPDVPYPLATVAGEPFNFTLPFEQAAKEERAFQRSSILAVLPSASEGSVSTQFTLNLLQKLVPSGWDAIVAFTQMPGISEKSLRPQFNAMTHDIFELPNFVRLADAPRIINHPVGLLSRSNTAKSKIVTGQRLKVSKAGQRLNVAEVTL